MPHPVPEEKQGAPPLRTRLPPGKLLHNCERGGVFAAASGLLSGRHGFVYILVSEGIRNMQTEYCTCPGAPEIWCSASGREGSSAIIAARAMMSRSTTGASGEQLIPLRKTRTFRKTATRSAPPAAARFPRGGCWALLKTVPSAGTP